MIKSKLSYIVLVIMLTGTLFIGFNASQTVAVGSVDADVEAGDTYYYTITDFPTFNEILDLTGASEGFNASNSISFTGDLVGSEIYAKVMNVENQNYSYWDGTQSVLGPAPAVDLASGLITGQAISVDVLADGVLTEVDIPAGVALPIPILFSSSTYLNVTEVDYDSADPFVQIPLVLNNDYTVHEAVLTQADNNLAGGAITTTNDASQFAAEFINVDIGASAELDGEIIFSKPSGLLNSVSFTVTNSSTNTEIVSFGLQFDRQDFKPLDVQVGDTFELSVGDAGFDYSVTSSNATEQSNIESQLSEIKQNMTNIQGDFLMEFEVREVRGMYYSIEGTVSDGDGGVEIFPDNSPKRKDLWMHGFGRLGPGAAIPTNDPARTFVEVWNEGTGDYVPTTERVGIHSRALPGPFTSSDYHIFNAWDNTLTFLVGVLNEDLQNALDQVVDEPGVETIGSSTSNSPQATFAFTSDSSDAEYNGWELSFNWDVEVWENQSVWSGNEFTDTFEVQTDGNVAVGVAYNNTVLDKMSLTGAISISVTSTHDTDVTTTDVSITNFIVEFDVTTTVEGAPDDGAAPVDDGGLLPGLNLPGFEAYLSIIAFFGMAVIVRTRSKFN